jgi:hypothetical protein
MSGLAGCAPPADEGHDPLIGEAAQAVSAACSGGVCTSATVNLTVRRAGASGSVYDASLNASTPTTNNGASQTSSTGPVGGAQRDTLIQFDLSTIPSGAALAALNASGVNVGNAYMTLAEGPLSTQAPSGVGTINVHQVTSSWTESTVTASTAPTYNATATVSFGNGYSASNTYPHFVPSINIPTLVQGWAATPSSNYGVLLEESPDTNHTTFVTSEYSAVGDRPALTVLYTLTCSTGFADCNNNGSDGCEKSVSTDVNNCGACGNVCPAGDVCAAGVCSTLCANVVCPPIDACHAAGTCNPANGQCVAGASLADTTTGLAHRWTFDEPSGTTALDAVGADNGTLGADASRVTSFDGSGAVLLTPNQQCDYTANVNFGTAPGAVGTADFTISFWVATTFLTPASIGSGDLIGNRIDPSGGDYISGRVRANGTSSLEVYDNTTDNASVALATPIDDGNWHNVVYTRSGGVLSAYIDGVSQGSATSAGPANILGTDPFLIGLSLPNCDNYNFGGFVAAYDDVRTYSRALAQCDASALAGTYAGTPATVLPPNNCAPNPCLNGGGCVSSASGYTCTCTQPYIGTNCEINNCAANPCQNGGTCNSVAGGGYTCQCPFPYTDAICAGPVPPCPCDADPRWSAILADPGSQFTTSQIGAQYFGFDPSPAAMYLGGVVPASSGAGGGGVSGPNTFVVPSASDPNYADDLSNAAFSALQGASQTDPNAGVAWVYSHGGQPYCTDESNTAPLNPTQLTACLAEINAAGTAAGQPTPLPDLPLPFALLAPGALGLAEIARRVLRRRAK